MMGGMPRRKNGMNRFFIESVGIRQTLRRHGFHGTITASQVPQGFYRPLNQAPRLHQMVKSKLMANNLGRWKTRRHFTYSTGMIQMNMG